MQVAATAVLLFISAPAAAWVPATKGIVPPLRSLARHPVLVMAEPPEQVPETPEPTVGISGVLGGGKTKADIETNTLAEAGSLAATVIPLPPIHICPVAALAFASQFSSSFRLH